MKVIYLAGSLFFASLLAWYFIRASSHPSEPQIVSDGIKSDPECTELLTLVAQRDRTIWAAVRKGQKPVGLRCSNIDIIKIMKSEGAYLIDADAVSEHSIRGFRFKIQAEGRWFLARKVKIGFREYDNIIMSQNSDGSIRSIIITQPYIT